LTNSQYGAGATNENERTTEGKRKRGGAYGERLRFPHKGAIERKKKEPQNIGHNVPPLQNKEGERKKKKKKEEVKEIKKKARSIRKEMKKDGPLSTGGIRGKRVLTGMGWRDHGKKNSAGFHSRTY